MLHIYSWNSWIGSANTNQLYDFLGTILERDQDYIWQYQIENNRKILSEITAKVDGPVFIFDLPNAASNSSKLSENTVQVQPYIIRRTAIVCCTVFKTFEAGGGGNL